MQEGGDRALLVEPPPGCEIDGVDTAQLTVGAVSDQAIDRRGRIARGGLVQQSDQ